MLVWEGIRHQVPTADGDGAGQVEVEHLSLTIATHAEEARARLGQPLLESLAHLEDMALNLKRESVEDDVEQDAQVRKIEESDTRLERRR